MVIKLNELNENQKLETSIKPDADSAVLRDGRRYVGTKETVSYVAQDFADSFSIGKYSNRFIWDVVNIDFQIAAIVGIFTGIWDVINDTFISTIVDRTRTRWGKFRPFLLWFKIPLTLLGILYWFLPVFFPGTPGNYVPKLVYYFAFGIINETAGTFMSISQTGLMSTITPNPLERVRLITAAKLWSRVIGEKVPELLMGVMIDLINSGIVKWSFKSLYMGMGIVTAVLSATASFFFYVAAKERVMQSIERPSVRQGFKAVFNNYPLLLLTLSDFLGGFSIGQSRSDYYIDVLGSATFQTIVGIPALPVQLFGGYAVVKPARRKFTSKSLWIFEDIYTDMCWMAVFAIGSVNKNFKKRKVMLPVMAVEEFLEMWVYGFRNVIPEEIRNETMDYCEWKNGYRMEAMTGVAKGLVTKIQRIFMNSFKNMVLAKIGYIQGKKIGTQTDKAKWWLFALGTGVPIITSSLGIIPKFLYPLNDNTRKKMYEDLFRRRAILAQDVASADSGRLKEIAEAELSGGYLKYGSKDDSSSTGA